MIHLTFDTHPSLEAAVFVTVLPAPLGDGPSPGWLQDLLRADAEAPLTRDEATRKAARDLLRHGGYKPTGRGKPASEYLVRAATEGTLRSINTVVDVCNVVSLHSGLPISVIDLDRAVPPFRVGLAAAEAAYAFNASGQTMRLGGLLCLHDAEGPCANAVKDSQRTKTHDGTRRTLTVIWGTNALPGHTVATLAWYRTLLDRLEAETTVVHTP